MKEEKHDSGYMGTNEAAENGERYSNSAMVPRAKKYQMQLRTKKGSPWHIPKESVCPIKT